MLTAEEIQEALAAPFEPSEVKFKPAVVSGNRALALGYVDARTIMDRLDDVCGLDGWADDYDVLPDGNVICHLRLKIGGEWIVKSDVGGASEQPDAGDRMKAAFSDALKRAAVRFGVGRYLYRQPQQWCEYDSVKRRFVEQPRIAAQERKAPRNGRELARRVIACDGRLTGEGMIQSGQLRAAVCERLSAAGYTALERVDDAQGIELACAAVREFVNRAKKPVQPILAAKAAG